MAWKLGDGVWASRQRAKAPQAENEVARDEDAAAVEAVGELTGEDGEADDRNELGEAEVGEVDVAVRERVDLEAHGGALHLDCEGREEAGGGVEAEVAVGEGGEG